jgi:hypothetical protein
MVKIQICPDCSTPAISVLESAVMYNLKDSGEKVLQQKQKWSICINQECNCFYFSKEIKFTISDLIKPLWFKDRNDNVPICYCSDLTRGEIKEAVTKGYKSIDEVQQFTKKNITGFCEQKNPLGKCCRNVFLKIITNKE